MIAIQSISINSLIRKLILSLLPAMLFLLPLMGSAQSGRAATSGPEGAFHAAANHYIAGQQQEALQTLEQGLRQYPNDQKLQALHQKLKQQQQQQQQQEQQQNEQQNQQSQQQQKSSAGQQSEEDLNQQGQEKEQPGEQQQQNAEEQQAQQREANEGEEGEEREVQARDPQGEVNKRLQEMNISPEKAKMLLEAMKSNEIQYLQQKQRQPSRRQKSTKPDW
ncbi:hypothetical protein [Cesiribacter sp. SM1]|uniref:hypothetical protein n=1 Tax=Cesiribacter sp. SM1 TaxID=2861196 RepID=UPI001CD30C4B|nr:hypothetical protein [Cesiribacter sp. SM1]